jgi:hypothetical protein
MVKLVPTIDPNELSGLVSHCYEIHRRDDMPESEVHMPQPFTTGDVAASASVLCSGTIMCKARRPPP